MGQELIKYKDLGTYLVDYDLEVNYGDRYIFVDNKDEAIIVDFYPSRLTSYKKVKVIWYYENGISLTNIFEDSEKEIENLYTEELARQINMEIINLILEQIENENRINEHVASNLLDTND